MWRVNPVIGAVWCKDHKIYVDSDNVTVGQPTRPCCSVGARADAEAIDAALRAGEGLGTVAKRHGLVKGTLGRHRANCLLMRGETVTETLAETGYARGETPTLEPETDTAEPTIRPETGVSHRGRGRPTDLTPALQEAIAKSIRNGCTMEDAAALNGISLDSLMTWKRKGADGLAPYDKFASAVARARAAAKRKAIREVRRGVMMNGAKDWKAWAWWLERMYPNEFGAQAAVHVKVEQELASALDRLKERLAPDLYVMVLCALAEEAGGSTATAGEKGSRANQPN